MAGVVVFFATAGFALGFPATTFLAAAAGFFTVADLGLAAAAFLGAAALVVVLLVVAFVAAGLGFAVVEDFVVLGFAAAGLALEAGLF